MVASTTMSYIRVLVRCRPLLPNEKSHGEECVLTVDDDEKGAVLLPRPKHTHSSQLLSTKPHGPHHGPADEETTRHFQFDRCFGPFQSQSAIFDEVGRPLVSAVLEGYNCGLIAWGKTGSGKSHSISGSLIGGVNSGILPRVCHDIFKTGGPSILECSCSYLEIHNERIYDLLRVPDGKEAPHLHVRSHPALGVYVEGVHDEPTANFGDVSRLVKFGNQLRTVRSTSTNANSSRSHVIFTMSVTTHAGSTAHRGMVRLVDLAGSERWDHAGNEHHSMGMMESGFINTSLAAFGRVVKSLLSAQSVSGSKVNQSHVPYRDSKLTFLLHDSIGGQSKTAILVTVSPAGSDWAETLTSLQFAQSVGGIKIDAAAHTKKIEPERSSEIEKLRREVGTLEQQLRTAQQAGFGEDNVLEPSEENPKSEIEYRDYLILLLKKSWDERVNESRAREKLRTEFLNGLGIVFNEDEYSFEGTPSDESPSGVKDLPHLINVNRDPLLTGCLKYVLPKDREVSIGSSESCDIKLRGLGVPTQVCYIRNAADQQLWIRPVMLQTGGPPSQDGVLSPPVSPRVPTQPSVMRNGIAVFSEVELNHQDCLLLGPWHGFTVVLPSKAATASVFANVAERASLDHMLQETEFAKEGMAVAKFIEAQAGVAKAKAFLKHFTSTARAVHEAQLLTAELRPHLRVELYMAWSPMAFSTAKAPELWIRLVQRPSSAAAKLRQCVASLEGKDYASCASAPLWQIREPEFMLKLEEMREAFTDREHGLKPSDDPWSGVGVLKSASGRTSGRSSPSEPNHDAGRAVVAPLSPSAARPDAFEGTIPEALGMSSDRAPESAATDSSDFAPSGGKIYVASTFLPATIGADSQDAAGSIANRILTGTQGEDIDTARTEGSQAHSELSFGYESPDGSERNNNDALQAPLDPRRVSLSSVPANAMEESLPASLGHDSSPANWAWAKQPDVKGHDAGTAMGTTLGSRRVSTSTFPATAIEGSLPASLGHESSHQNRTSIVPAEEDVFRQRPPVHNRGGRISQSSVAFASKSLPPSFGVERGRGSDGNWNSAGMAEEGTLPTSLGARGVLPSTVTAQEEALPPSFGWRQTDAMTPSFGSHAKSMPTGDEQRTSLPTFGILSECARGKEYDGPSLQASKFGSADLMQELENIRVLLAERSSMQNELKNQLLRCTPSPQVAVAESANVRVFTAADALPAYLAGKT